MASKNTNLIPKNIVNPLFSTGIANFPAEEFTQGVLLVPPPIESQQLLSKGLGGEVDTFLGQDVTDLGLGPIDSTDSVQSDHQTPRLLPPPPPTSLSNFKAVPVKSAATRATEHNQHCPIEPRSDSEPGFKQIPLDDSVPLYNPSAVLKSSNRENTNELHRTKAPFDGGVPLFDPSRVGSVLPPHAIKRPLPHRTEHSPAPTPAALDPAYSSLSKHISTCHPSLVIDSGPSESSLNHLVSPTRKSSDSSSTHELHALNSHDRDISSASLPSAYIDTPHSLQNSHLPPLGYQPAISATSVFSPNIPNALSKPESLVPVNPSEHLYASDYSSASISPLYSSAIQPPLPPPSNFSPSAPPEVSSQSYFSSGPLGSSFNSNGVQQSTSFPQTEQHSTQNVSSLFSTSEYSIPSFLNPLNLFKRGSSPAKPVTASSSNDSPLSSEQSVYQPPNPTPPLSSTSCPVVDPTSNSSLPPTAPLAPPPLTGFQASSAPLSTLPKVHHSFSTNPYSRQSQNKTTSPPFKPEHYFTPIPAHDLPKGAEDVTAPVSNSTISQNYLNQSFPSSNDFFINNTCITPNTSQEQQSVSDALESAKTSLTPTLLQPDPLNRVQEETQSFLTYPAGIVSSNCSNSPSLPPVEIRDSEQSCTSQYQASDSVNSSIPLFSKDSFTSSQVLLPPLSQNHQPNYFRLGHQPESNLNISQGQSQESKLKYPTVPSPGQEVGQLPPGPPLTTTLTKSYRLSSLKRPTYAPVPDLSVSNSSQTVTMTSHPETVIDSETPKESVQPPLVDSFNQSVPPVQPIPFPSVADTVSSLQLHPAQPPPVFPSADHIDLFPSSKPIPDQLPHLPHTLPQTLPSQPLPLSDSISQSPSTSLTSVQPVHQIQSPIVQPPPTQTLPDTSDSLPNPFLPHHPLQPPVVQLPPNVPPAATDCPSRLSTSQPFYQPYTAMAVSQTYRPVYHHWFYKHGGDKKNIWTPFSMADSLNLEQQFTSDVRSDESRIVATDGGRYDVDVDNRKKIAVYWHEETGEVRRCSWFVKGPVDSRYQPYDENIAALLEEEYKTACNKNEWNRRVELADGEVIIIHSPNSVAHHQRSSSPDPWGNPPPIAEKPRIVKRGLDEFDIPEGEPTQVDHLLLLVHGIGKVCDLRFRSLVEVVDDFRSISVNLIGSHYKTALERGKAGRVEVLPVEWHRALHTEAIDQRLNDITLPSIPKARQFTNETLLDILFYTSPVFCERIIQAVGAELNRVYSLYLERNPGYKGGVSLGGHSLGSLILFDMLCHQKPPHPKLSSAPSTALDEDDEDISSLGCLKTRARVSRRMSYVTIGTAGTGQPYIVYPQLNFQPRSFFALGSPIGMFVTVRGIESLGEDFRFPTCPSFFNIFHPNDPVAYRIEGLINPEMAHHPAVLIPHHKGRKRMHLELKETMAHVTTALKQKLMDSVKNTWSTVSSLTRFSRLDQAAIENQVDKVLEDEILCKDRSDDSASSVSGSVDGEGFDLKVGFLNGGRRIDYVLQEAPLETFNQYISAVRSHLVYWESEDTMLLMLKEIYGAKGITADCQVPQPILPFDISADVNVDPGSAYSRYPVCPSSPSSRHSTIAEEM